MGCKVLSCLPKAQGCDHLKADFETARFGVAIQSSHGSIGQGPRWCVSARGASDSIRESEVRCNKGEVQHP